MPRNCIRQRPALNTRTRMDNHSGALVYHGKKIIFEDDIDRDILRLESRDRCLDQVDLDLFATADLVRWLYRFVIDENIFVLDQTLKPRARPAVDILRKIYVETLAGIKFDSNKDRG